VKAARGVAGERARPEAAAKVAEIEALQREAAVAERLAALREAVAAPPRAGQRSAKAKSGGR
jgi:hypothetical protein